ncbi:MAG: hypothetical protein ACK5NN_01925, partial [Sphingomonadaceae bacterium]
MSAQKVRRTEQVILLEQVIVIDRVSKVRRWSLVDGRSIRSVARATGLSRNTIKKYLKADSPPSY